MTLAPWRSPLARALHLNRSLVYARYVQLATVQVDGHPSNRTVVFRGFLDDSNQLKFVVDARSEKITDIRFSPWGAVCWYFPKSREQFRLAGVLTLIHADFPDEPLQAVRSRQWQELSDSARLQFAWADPGKPRASQETFSPPPPDSQHPLPEFCLLLLDPAEVDHLELRGEPQNRHCYQQSDQGWLVHNVNP